MLCLLWTLSKLGNVLFLEEQSGTDTLTTPGLRASPYKSSLMSVGLTRRYPGGGETDREVAYDKHDLRGLEHSLCLLSDCGAGQKGNRGAPRIVFVLEGGCYYAA